MWAWEPYIILKRGIPPRDFITELNPNVPWLCSPEWMNESGLYLYSMLPVMFVEPILLLVQIQLPSLFLFSCIAVSNHLLSSVAKYWGCGPSYPSVLFLLFISIMTRLIQYVSPANIQRRLESIFCVFE